MRKVVLPQVVRNILPATGMNLLLPPRYICFWNVISVVELYFTGNTVATQNYQYFPTFTIIADISFFTFTITMNSSLHRTSLRLGYFILQVPINASQ